MRRLEIITLLLTAGSMVGLCALGLFHYDYSKIVLRFPLLLTGMMLLVIAVRCVVLLRPKEGLILSREGAGSAHKAEVVFERGWTGAAVRLLAVLPLVMILGYPLGLASYAFLYIKGHGKSWTTAAGLALGILALTYVGFVKLLSVPLPVLPAWLGYVIGQ